MRDKEIQEGLADLAQRAEMDHEVQMARSDLYKIAKYAIKLHDMLKNVSESQGLEGWQQSKITKAADYMGSVYHAMDYDMQFGEQQNESAQPTDYKQALAQKLAESKGVCSECGNPSWRTLGLTESELEEWDLEEEKKKGRDGKACWKGYRYAGSQKKGGKIVDKCVKVKRKKKKS